MIIVARTRCIVEAITPALRAVSQTPASAARRARTASAPAGSEGGAPQASALRLRTFEACHDAGPDKRALELREHSEHLEHHASPRRARIERLSYVVAWTCMSPLP